SSTSTRSRNVWAQSAAPTTPSPPLLEGARPSPAPSETAPETAPPAAAVTPGRYFLAVLVDETSSEQSNRQATLREVFQFLETSLPQGVEALLMRFDGTLHVECPWTSDTERLRRAAAAIAQHRYAPRLEQPGYPRDPGQGTTLSQLDAMEAVLHVRSSLAGLFDALRFFPEKPGRKGLYFVSDGMPFLSPSEIIKDLIATSPTANDSALATPRDRMEAAYDRDLLLDGLAWDRTRSASLLTDIARLALVRGIEINPVRSTPHDYGGNVRTDRSFSSRARASAGRSLDASSGRGMASAPMTDIAVGGSMTAVAEATGGEAVLSRRKLEDGLKQEVLRGNTAYALSFRDPFAGDHRFHRIEISSVKRGLSLRYRRGYRILDVRESLIQATVNRLYVPADRNDLGVRFEIRSLGIQNGRAVAQITIAYPAPPEAGGKANEGGTVQIIGTCAVRDGKISEPIDISGKTEPASFGEKAWLARAGRLNLLPGAYRFSFAIRDEQTGITSYLTFDRKLP
ncbi:MAG TPA: VWA domain-containing protein, partial [Thermoanaerobaculia bacterium]|nr:VWA domain-containing protein [Thermoanaerobaculia bacterium]